MAKGTKERRLKIKKHLLILLGLLIVSLFLCDCGRKRAPVPPGTLRPERIKDLSYKIVKDGAILSWSVPRRNHDGSPLSHIKEFHLYKAEIPLDAACLTCPPRYGKPIVIKYDKKPEPGKRIVYEDTTLRQGLYYTYQVKTVKGLFNVSDYSNKVSFAWHSPPKAPTNLSAKVFEEGVELTWRAPTAFQNGESLAGRLEYKIYRKFGDETDWNVLSGTTEKTRFFDKIRRTYRQVSYRVSAIFKYFDTEIEGPKSATITVKARGLQNIPAPTGVRLSKTKEGIKVTWKEVERPGIVGYYIFRKDESGLVVKLNFQAISGPPFIDRTFLRPGRYAYWVTAIDDSYPPNQSKPSRPSYIVVK